MKLEFQNEDVKKSCFNILGKNIFELCKNTEKSTEAIFKILKRELKSKACFVLSKISTNDSEQTFLQFTPTDTGKLILISKIPGKNEIHIGYTSKNS